MARRITTPPPMGPRRPAPALPCDLDGELKVVLAAWDSQQLHAEQTLTRMCETVARFSRRLKATGVASFCQVTAEDAAGFVLAHLPDGTAPQVPTQHWRRTSVRVLFGTLRNLGYPVADPTVDLKLPPRGLPAVRPLSGDEVTLCRAIALATAGPTSVRAAAWALGEATATSSEIARARICDLDDPTHPTVVVLSGTARVHARRATLTAWGAGILACRVTKLTGLGLGEQERLVYRGEHPPGGPQAQASVCNAVRDTMHAAGLGGEKDLRPESLRNWVGRAAYDTGLPIEQVAQLLGNRSLDTTAGDIALVWDQLGGGQ